MQKLENLFLVQSTNRPNCFFFVWFVLIFCLYVYLSSTFTFILEKKISSKSYHISNNLMITSPDNISSQYTQLSIINALTNTRSSLLLQSIEVMYIFSNSLRNIRYLLRRLQCDFSQCKKLQSMWFAKICPREIVIEKPFKTSLFY